MGRAPCCDKANVKKGPWSPEEDARLKAYIEQYGTGGNWIALPQKIGLKRCGKSCRLRWLNYLRPNIKHGDFTEEEDNLICSLYISIGSRWSIIAAQLPGRTDNDIKNYWNTKLKKRLLGRRKQCSGGNIMNRLSAGCANQEDHNSSCNVNLQPTLSNSSLERLQLHMQLQSLQNPSLVSAFLNNPASAMWPKLHPIQEKLLLQSINESTSISSLINHTLNSSMQQLNNNDNTNTTDNDHDRIPVSTLHQHELEVQGGDDNTGPREDHERNSNNDVGVQQNDQNGTFGRTMSSFQLADLEAFLGNNDNRTATITSTLRTSSLSSGNFVGHDHEFDFECFTEMNGGSIWW